MKKIILLSLLLTGFFGETFGQNYAITPNLPLAEISGAGTSVSMTNGAASAALPIGFSFNFYGNTFTDFYINPKGAITFGVGSFASLPPGSSGGTIPNNMIAFGWVAGSADFTNANVDYFTTGVSPNRILVLNFKNVVQNSYANTTIISVQLQLYEGSNGKIEIHSTSNVAVTSNTPFNGFIVMEKTISLKNGDGTKYQSITPITSGTSTSQWNVSNTMIRLNYCPTPPPVSTGVTPNTAFCVTASPTTLTASCASGTPVWYNFMSSGSTVLSNLTVTPTTTTTYYVRCESGGTPNCTSAFTGTTISVNPLPSLTKNPTTPIASGSSVVLSAGNCNYGVITWGDGSTQGIGSNGTVSKTYYPSSTTTYTATCNLYPTCPASIIVNVVTPPTLTASVNPLCAGSPTVLTAGNCAGGTITWNNGLSAGLSQTVSPSTTTNYIATCSTTGLTASVNVVVVLLPSPPSTITLNPTTPVNPGASVTLTASACVSGSSLKWLDNSSSTNPRTVTPAATTTYSAKCVNGTCESATNTSTTVSVNGPPVISASDNPICGVLSVSFYNNPSVTLTAAGCSNNVVWSSTPSNAPKPTGNSGTLFVSAFSGDVTYTAFCPATGLTSASYLLSYIPNTTGTITASPNPVTTVGQTVALAVPVIAGTFTWSASTALAIGYGGGTQIGTGTSLSHTTTTTTEYTVQRAVSGCTFFFNLKSTLSINGQWNGQ